MMAISILFCSDAEVHVSLSLPESYHKTLWYSPQCLSVETNWQPWEGGDNLPLHTSISHGWAKANCCWSIVLGLIQYPLMAETFQGICELWYGLTLRLHNKQSKNHLSLLCIYERFLLDTNEEIEAEKHCDLWKSQWFTSKLAPKNLNMKKKKKRGHMPCCDF